MKTQQETFDRVWQRVRSGPEPELPELTACPVQLPALAVDTLQAAEDYALLARRVRGRLGRRLYALAAEKQAQAAMLQGLCAVTGSRCVAEKHPGMPREPLRQTLHRCCVRELQWLEIFRMQQAEPAFGPAFSRLIQRQQRCCADALELLGGLGVPQVTR